MALRLRRGTNAERLLTTPLAGELIYTTDTKLVYVGDSTTVGGTIVTGGSGGSTTLDALTDTDLTGALNNDVLKFNSGTNKWEAAADSVGSLTGSFSGTFDGDVTGSVFADDSTLLIDGVRSSIVGQIDTKQGIDVTVNFTNRGYQQTGIAEPGALGPQILSRSSKGTVDAPIAIVGGSDGDGMLDIRGLGYDGVDYTTSGIIRIAADLDSTVSPGIVPARIMFITANSAGSLQNLLIFNSQGRLGLGLTRPDERLHVNGNAKVNGFVQFGSLTTTERDALTAANGMVIYNSTDNKFQGYENGAWVNLI